jgi:hypothetical protein
MTLPRRVVLTLLLCLFLPVYSFGSAYNARPKLVVLVVIDQFRTEYLERYRDQFGEGDFRLFLDHGAYFINRNYNYANTRTAPGHATLLTGTYTSGHGIIAHEWWDPQKKKMVASVEDDATTLLGIGGNVHGFSPHNLLADTLSDVRFQLAKGEAPNTELGARYLHSYSPHGGWYVFGIPTPFNIGIESGTDHASPYTYDTHLPLAFYGLPFEPGAYRTHAEPVDLAVTLASLLGINAPTHAIGRVLTEAIVARRNEASGRPSQKAPGNSEKIEPASLVAKEGVR